MLIFARQIFVSQWGALIAALAMASFALAGEIGAAEEALQRGEYQLALRRFAILAEGGHAQAQLRLGMLYHQGKVVAADHEIAARWYRAAADQGLAEAQFNLGNLYLLGEGVEKNDALALSFYRAAALQGHRLAEQNMRELYRGAGVTMPPLTTAGIAAPPGDAAEQAAITPIPAGGHAGRTSIDANEATAIMHALEHGIRVIRKGQAVDLEAIAKYAQAGHALRETHAANFIAMSVERLNKLVEAGDAAAQYELAERYMQGLGIDQDIPAAHRLYRESAAAGFTLARSRLKHLETSSRKE